MHDTKVQVPAFIISLERAQLRRQQSKEQLFKYCETWEIIDAIDGLKLQNFPLEYDEKRVKRLLGFSLTLAEIGCFLSHREAWIKCLKSNNPVLILEDDFIFESSFKEAIQFAIENQSMWDILRLHALTDSNHTDLINTKSLKIVQNDGDPLGATAYMLKPSAAKKLLIYSNEIFEPLDHYLEHAKRHGLQILALKPYPIKTSGDETTIFDRPTRQPITGIKKLKRSIHRTVDRLFNSNPWFPK